MKQFSSQQPRNYFSLKGNSTLLNSSQHEFCIKFISHILQEYLTMDTQKTATATESQEAALKHLCSLTTVQIDKLSHKDALGLYNALTPHLRVDLPSPLLTKELIDNFFLLHPEYLKNIEVA